MNTVVTSRKDILKAARELALAESPQPLSIRAVAARCGISVGTIYYYFPTKDDLTLALVADVWQEVFHPESCPGNQQDFQGMIRWLWQSAREGAARYPRFFARHAGVVTDKSKGRLAMEGLLGHIRMALLKALREDPTIPSETWRGDFTPEAFAAFVLRQLADDLVTGGDHGAFLEELILRTIQK